MVVENSVLFLGMAKNCCQTLFKTIQAVAALESQGMRVGLWVGENGSTDGTRELLEDSKFPGVRRIDLDGIASETDRLRRMAMGRETILRAVSGSEEFKLFNYVAVLDLDSAFLAQVSHSSLLQAIGTLRSSPNLFCVSASSTPTYFDLLAYVDGEADFSHLPEKFQRTKWNLAKHLALFYNEIYPSQQNLTTRDDFLCDSAFNGMALYRSAEFKTGSYLALPGQVQRCEHVHFNQSIARGRKVLVSADLKVQAPSEHIKQSIVILVSRLIKNLLRSRLVRL